MTEHIALFILLFSIIVCIGQIFDKTKLPISLVLIITGIFLSFIPHFPIVTLNPELVLNIFLPLLIYQISAFSSWKEIQKNITPIALLSIGHVVFITCIIAILIHNLIPSLNWPLAFVLGAVISPPDDVAIVSIAEKVKMPQKITTILEGEAIFNDATALIIFRFALAAAFYQQFSAANAILSACLILIGEAIYGLCLGYLVGQLRLKFNNSMYHIIASVLTPFFAYLPVEILGGSGILATAITGFIIGNVYSVKFTPEFRLFSRSFWPAVGFVIQSILFLLVGLNMGVIVANISAISHVSLFIYATAVILTVIAGRFIWVFCVVSYLPYIFTYKKSQKKAYRWQYPFVISWAGMRGGVSLAAALAVPTLPIVINGANAKDLLIFLVVCVIAVTFILQGLSLPWLIKKLGLVKYGTHEAFAEHVSEIKARLKTTKAGLKWLKEFKDEVKDDEKMVEEVDLYIREYRMLKTHLRDSLQDHADISTTHDEELEIKKEGFILTNIIAMEKEEVLELWRLEKINLRIRNKLLDRLDHRIRHVTG